MQIKPRGDNVLIRRSTPELKAGALHIPETATKPPQYGVVVDVGPGKRDARGVLVPCRVKPGDTVLFASDDRPPAPYIVMVDGEELLIGSEERIHAIAKQQEAA